MMNRLTYPLLILALGLFGCPTQPINPEPTKPKPTDIVSLPPTTQNAAPWHDDAQSIAIATSPSFGQPVILALGDQLSIHRSQLGLYLVHQKQGLLGRLRLPEAWVWVGIDGRDNVWGATAKGELYTQSAQATLKKQWASAGTYPNVSSWDVSGTYAGMIQKNQVRVSKDLGKTWSQQGVPEGMVAKQIYTRHDGVIAIFGMQKGARTTYLSKDLGKTWVRSAFQPQNLKRHGSWIWNADPNCVGVLSRDGSTWSASPHLTPLPGWQDARNAMLSLRMSAHQITDRVANNGLTLPPAVPGADMRHVGDKPTCQDPIPDAKRLKKNQGTPQDRGPQPTPCQGALCLHDAPSPQPPLSAVFYTIVPQWRTGQPAQTLTIDVDRNDVQVDTIKQNCTPKRVFTLRGFGVLLCEQKGETHILTRTKKTPWRAEVVIETVPTAIGGASVGVDGTIVLHGRCPRGGICELSYVRHPRSTHDSAWSPIAKPRVAAAWPLDLGRVLVAQTIPSAPGRLTLGVVSGRRQQTLTTVTNIKEKVQRLSLDDAHQVVLHLGDEFKTQRYNIQYNGALISPK